MNLKAKFAVAFTGNTLLALSLFAGAYFVFERRSALEAQRQEEAKTVEKTASVCQSMFVASSPIIVLGYIDALKQDAALESASCVDTRGLVQAHSDHRRIGTKLTDLEDLQMLRSGVLARRLRADPSGAPILEWSAPVLVMGRRVGTARIAYDYATLQKEVRERLWTSLRRPMTVAGGTFLLAFFSGLAIAWSLSRPIGKLEDAAHAFGEGNLDFKTSIVRRSDELGRLAREMNSMAAKLKQLDELKDDFVALVSHDLRGPLAGITMYVDYLAQGVKGPVNKDQVQMLDVISQNARRLAAFVNNILDATKIKAGKMEYRFGSHDLDALVREIIPLFAVLMQDQGIRFAYAAEPNLPPIRADGEKVQQAVTNLLSNAVKFTPRNGQITLKIENTADSALRVSVQDSGPGISPEDLSKLFKKFGQLNTPAQGTAKLHGTGLGLMIAKNVIEAHGGRIWAESSPGRGSKFCFTVPKTN